ncbi:hypothetical protein MUK42_01678 [Musa troglodytarum]|uniref:Uncharacterized protein n=1 Tax=Musa troglodytarum TaxID=320322 RepID=A0A9E7L0Q0_9LILI|nr:hypothetical protein MUK42_17148 [Musa troglodytarum]URE39547.1 hypothetical protein MUK42_01678 [Musa troglodytarum]
MSPRWQSATLTTPVGDCGCSWFGENRNITPSYLGPVRSPFSRPLRLRRRTVRPPPTTALFFHPLYLLEEIWLMASSSPGSSGKIGDSITAIAAIDGNITSQRTGAFEMPKPSLRGLNKPKCIKCGNVARSRCPFQSCKSCCAKAENPCHIHVLKHNGTLPDKPPPSSSTAIEQPSNDVSSSGASGRLNSLRQISTNVANILRARKPLNRKDAVNINRWRFMKLREHFERDIEVENEAFERYMQNVNLLEETFSIMQGTEPGDQTALVAGSSEKLVSEIKMKLKSNSERAESFQERTRNLINQKLCELQKGEFISDDCSTNDDDLDDHREFKRSRQIMKWRHHRNSTVDDVINKLNKAHSEEDLRACMDLKLQYTSDNLTSEDHSTPKQESADETALSFRSPPKMWMTAHVDQDTLANINTQFSSLSSIAEL